MSFSEVEDRLVKAYDFTNQASDSDLKEFFAKLEVGVVGIQRYVF